MTTYSRAEIWEQLRQESEVLVLGTALLFLTFASLWSQFALGSLMAESSIYLAWLLIHGSSFLALKYRKLETIMMIAAFLALQLYFKNSLIDFQAPFLPMAPVFFLVSAVTLTGYRGERWKRSASLAFLSWASVFAWSLTLSPEAQAAQKLPFFIGALLSFILFGAFFGSVAFFSKKMASLVSTLGPRSEYSDKRIHASKLQTLGELAASVAHEINTPLTSIKGYVHQFKMELSESETLDRAMLLNFSERINFNLNRVAQITKVLRNFSRDPNHEVMQSTSLKDVFHDTLTLMKHHVKAEGVDLQVDIPDDDIKVSGSLVQLSQLLVNLLSNAKDACLQSPLRKIVLGFAKKGDQVEVWVEDSGPGIPVAIQENVFRPFFTTKEVGKGTGLGLHISQLIAERHNSQLNYTCPLDENGKPLGTRFFLTLNVLAVVSSSGSEAA
jgi:signal transduction histidine kinase